MAFPTDTTLTAGLTFTVQLLPASVNGLTSRVPTQYTVTNNANVAVNDTTISLSAAGFVTGETAIVLEQGTKLTFGSTTITLTTDSTITATPTSFPIVAAPGTVAANATTTTGQVYTLLGGDDTGFEVTDKEVETRSFEDGLYDNARKVMIGGVVPWNGFYRKGNLAIDRGIELASFSNREVLLTLTYPDGYYRQAVAFIKNYKESNKLDDIRRLSWSFRVVGTFTMSKPAAVIPTPPTGSPSFDFSQASNSMYVPLVFA